MWFSGVIWYGLVCGAVNNCVVWCGACGLVWRGGVRRVARGARCGAASGVWQFSGTGPTVGGKDRHRDLAPRGQHGASLWPAPDGGAGDVVVGTS